MLRQSLDLWAKESEKLRELGYSIMSPDIGFFQSAGAQTVGLRYQGTHRSRPNMWDTETMF